MESALSDPERAALGALWAFRARGEHEIASRYADLGVRLRADGAAASIVERVVAAGADEARHRDLCAALAARMRHPPLQFTADRLPPIAPHELVGRARLAYEMVALFCVTESINATLLLRSWQQSRDETTRGALHTLLADEVEHSRIGWAYLASEPDGRDDIASRLPIMLGAAVHEAGSDAPFLAARTPPEASPALVAHGLLGQAALRAVFLEAMNDVVLPGLELCGVATGAARAWLAGCTARWT